MPDTPTPLQLENIPGVRAAITRFRASTRTFIDIQILERSLNRAIEAGLSSVPGFSRVDYENELRQRVQTLLQNLNRDPNNVHDYADIYHSRRGGVRDMARVMAQSTPNASHDLGHRNQVADARRRLENNHTTWIRTHSEAITNTIMYVLLD